MPAVQSTYPLVQPVAVAGMIANMELSNRITRTASGNIGFGLPVQRVGDHNCILASGETLQAAAAVAGTNTGNGVFGAVTPTTGVAKKGTYRVNIVAAAANAGTFEVEDPDGNVAGVGTVGVAFSKNGIAFTLADGATDFLVGDSFTFVISATVGTIDLDMLGIAIRDPSLVHTTVDRYEALDSVSIMSRGVMWVPCGATVLAGDLAFWDPVAGLWTNVVAANVPFLSARFDNAGVNGGLVLLSLPGNH